jgi:hypothetical protein
VGYADSSGRANVGIARSNGHLYGFSSLHIILLVPQFSYWKGGGGTRSHAGERNLWF